MDIPDQIAVTHQQPDDVRKEFIYDQALRRVSDLNRSSFSYRTLYATIIAAYVGALTILASYSSSAVILPAVDVYLLALHAISLIVFATTLIICFFDYIFQELIEGSLRAAERIEKTTPGLGWGKIALVSHRRGSLTGLRVAITMSLFYFIPALALFSIIALTAVVVVPSDPGDLNKTMSERLCSSAVIIDKLNDPVTRVRFEQITKNLYCAVPIFDLATESDAVVPLAKKLAKPTQYEFPEVTRQLVGLGYVISVGFFGYFFLYSIWRISGRALAVYPTSWIANNVLLRPSVRKWTVRVGWAYTIAIFSIFFASMYWPILPEYLLAYTLFFL